MTLSRLLILGLLPTARLLAAASSNLLVDQLGWLTSSTKVAILAAPQVGTGSPSVFTPGASFEIRRVSDNSTAFSGVPAVFGGGATHAQSGDKGWWADFSGLTTPDSYYLYLPGGSSPGAVSYNFDLGDSIYNSLLQASVKSYFYQRCGTAILAANGGTWTHAACHVKANQDLTAHLYNGSDQGAGTARDVSGGWHDAGDYRKYVSFTQHPLWDLMHTAEWYPCVFGDNTGIPESGNGVPDILDEVKYELDWLLKMQRADGALYSGVFVTTGDDGTNDPSTSVVTRYYANRSTGATGTGAFAFALGARLLGAYPAYAAYAATLQAAAINAWAYLTANTTNQTYNITNFQNADANVSNANDKQLRLAAAAELFHLTGGATYKTYFDANYNSATLTESGHNPITSGYFETGASQMTQRALVSYALAPGATAAIVTAIKNSCKNGANVPVGNYLSDLYRAYMYDGHYTWGSNQAKATWGNNCLYAIKIGANPATNATWNSVASEYLHYFFGRNPLGWTYISQAQLFGADQPITQFFHSWFFDGGPYDTNPAPGFLAGGPNKFYGGDQPNIATQPQQKAYRDWNTSWPQNSWEVTENGIYYQAKFTMLCAAFASCAAPANSPTPTPVVSPTDSFTTSPTQTVSSTRSATPTTSPTRSVTPTLTATRSSSPTPSVTLTPTGTPTLSVTSTLSPTATHSPTVTPLDTATLSPTPADSGVKRVDASLASPNPNPGSIMVKLAGNMEELELRIYTPALVMASKSLSGPLPMGWSGIAIDPGFLASASNGIYYYRLLAKNGEVQREAATGKFYILR
jgi:hypothetical protein